MKVTSGVAVSSSSSSWWDNSFFFTLFTVKFVTSTRK